MGYYFIPCALNKIIVINEKLYLRISSLDIGKQVLPVIGYLILYRYCLLSYNLLNVENLEQNLIYNNIYTTYIV